MKTVVSRRYGQSKTIILMNSFVLRKFRDLRVPWRNPTARIHCHWLCAARQPRVHSPHIITPTCIPGPRVNSQIYHCFIIYLRHPPQSTNRDSYNNKWILLVPVCPASGHRLTRFLQPMLFNISTVTLTFTLSLHHSNANAMKMRNGVESNCTFVSHTATRVSFQSV